MIRTAIIDDEVKSRSNLKNLLQRFCPDITIVSESGNVEKGITELTISGPDLVFLDVEMHDGSGFEMLDRIKDRNFETIFVTAYSEYALQAIKNDAVDYLLKPVDIAELQLAVKKAEKRIHQKNGTKNVLPMTPETITQDKKNRIAIPKGDGLEFIYACDIVRLFAKGSYTEIFCNNGSKYLTSKLLKEYEDMLPQQSFFRVHNSHMINLEHVQHYHRGIGGYVTMADGSEINISKRRKKEFLNLFSK